MGVLQSALRSKLLSRNGCEFARVGTATMQGFRMAQEDAHRVVFSLPRHPNISLFGVFDGHGGAECSRFVRKHLVHRINALDSFDDESLIECFIAVDKLFLAEENTTIREHGSTCIVALVERVDPAGTGSRENSTASVALDDSKENSSRALREEKTGAGKDALVEENVRSSNEPCDDSEEKNFTADEGKQEEFKITAINVGDSRCVLVKASGAFEELSKDHKPMGPVERKRIIKAGGTVMNNRVDGNLAVSRAFGDWCLKANPSLSPREQKVSCEPEIMTATCRSGDLLFLSCDGLFEHMVTGQVVKSVMDNFDADDPDPARTLAEVFERALDSGSTDNMTAVLVHFDSRVGASASYQHGEQFLPGPLFLRQHDQTFTDAYYKDAQKGFLPNLDILHLAAYHQDFKTVPPSVLPEIRKEIKRLDPVNLSMEGGAIIFNSYHWSILISDEILDVLQDDLKISTITEFISCLQDNSHTKATEVRKLFTEKTMNKLKSVINIWDSVSACDENGLTEEERKRRGSGSRVSGSNRLYFSPSRRDHGSNQELNFQRKRLDSDDVSDVDSNGDDTYDTANVLKSRISSGDSTEPVVKRLTSSEMMLEMPLTANESMIENPSRDAKTKEEDTDPQRTLTITDVKLDQLIENDTLDDAPTNETPTNAITSANEPTGAENASRSSESLSDEQSNEAPANLASSAATHASKTTDHESDVSTPLVQSPSASYSPGEASDSDETTSLISA